MKENQTNVILSHLQMGLPLTALGALNQYSCFRLASRINDIKKLGYTIESKMIVLPTGKRVAEYRLAA